MSGGDNNIIFSLPESQILPISIDPESGVNVNVHVFTGLKILSRHRNYLVPILYDGPSGTAPEGAIVYIESQPFYVTRTTRKKVKIPVKVPISRRRTTVKEVTITIKNLAPIKKLSKEESKEVLADMANRYKANPSFFYPVAIPYAIWILGWKHLLPEEAISIPTLTEEEKEKLLPEWLSKGYVVAFTLISEYKFAQSKYEVGPATVRETRIVPVEKVADFRNFRSRFYRFLKQKAIKTPMGWWLIDTSETTMNQLNELMNDYARIVHKYLGPNYPFKPIYVVETYIPRKTLVSFVRDYIVELKASIEAIEKKLEELKAEEEDKKVRRKIKRIVRNKEFLEEALKKAEEFMKKIETKAKVEVSGRLMALRMEL